MTDKEKIAALVEALAPFAKYAEGVKYFTGPNAIAHLEYESSVVGKRIISKDDFARAQRVYQEASE